jgi:hypothetical protein
MNNTIPESKEDQKTDNSPYQLVSSLRNHGNYTLGVLLTAVEASFGDSKQGEALKAQVRREMFALMDRNQSEVYEREGMQRPGLAPKETWIDGQDAQREEPLYVGTIR